MIVQVPSSPIRIRAAAFRYHVHVQVRNATVVVRLAQSEADLVTAVGGVGQGLSVVQADGVVSLWWAHDLWAISDGSALVDFEFV